MRDIKALILYIFLFIIFIIKICNSHEAPQEIIWSKHLSFIEIENIQEKNIKKTVIEAERLIGENRHREAVDKLEKVLPLIITNEDDPDIIWECYKEIGLGYSRLALQTIFPNKAELEKGIEYYEKGMKLQKKSILKEPEKEISLLNERDRICYALNDDIIKSIYATDCINFGLNTVYGDTGNIQRAIYWYKESLDVLSQIKDKELRFIQLLPTLTTLADAYADSGNYGEALMYYERGMEVIKTNEIGKIPIEGRAAFLNSRANFYLKIGHDEESREQLSALPLGVKFSDSFKDKIYYDAQKHLLVFKGVMSEEERSELLKLSTDSVYQKSIEGLFQNSHEIAKAKILSGIDDLLYTQGKYEEAVKKYEEIAGFHSFGNLTYHVRAYLRLNKPEWALDIAESSLYKAKEAQNSEELIESYNSLGEVLQYSAENKAFVRYSPDCSVESGIKYSNSFRAPWLPIPEKEVLYKDAIECYKKAILFFEQLRSSLGQEEYRRTLMIRKTFIYDNLIKLLLKMNKEENERELQKEALYYAERAKSRTFLEKLAMKGKEELENSKIASLLSVNPAPIENIQQWLDKDVTVIEYYTTEDVLYIWLLSKDDIKTYEVVLKEKDLEDKVNEFPFLRSRQITKSRMAYVLETEKKKMAEKEDDKEKFSRVARELYTLIIAPVEKDIKTEKLIIVPHGVLHRVPFCALTDGKRYLIDKYAISVLPAVSVIEFIVKQRKVEKESLLAFVNPTIDYKQDLKELKDAETAIRNISNYFKKKEIYIKREATEGVAKINSSWPNVIHFATHGEFNGQQPLASGLLLVRDRENDGILQVQEIFGMDLRNVNLVTLCACETGISRIEGGDDLVGLSRAFIYAGASSLLAALWEVEEKSTAIVAEQFYKNWKIRGMSKAESLRQAQINLKKSSQYDHPYCWASFVMIGDWR